MGKDHDPFPLVGGDEWVEYSLWPALILFAWLFFEAAILVSLR